MNQINNTLLDMMTALSQTVKLPAAETSTRKEEPKKFESLLKEKHQDAAAETGEKPQPERQETTGSEEQEIPDEQYILAASLNAVPQPQIVYLEPEQENQTKVLAAIPETAPVVTGENVTAAVAAPVQTEPAAETAVAETVAQFTVEVKDAPETVETKDALETVEVRPEQTVVEKPAGETVEVPHEQIQPRQKPDEDGGEPAYQEETEAPALEVKPQTRESERKNAEEFAVTGDNWNEPVFEKIEAAPVKVADAPVPLEEPQAAGQLGKELLEAVTDGREQIQISLSPEGLGELHVTIEKAENGAMSVVFHATTNKAANLLQMHSDNLRYMMAANLRTEVQIEVRETQPQQQNQQSYQQPNDGREQQGRQQQPQQEQRQNRRDTHDFLQKLRLGLTDLSQVV